VKPATVYSRTDAAAAPITLRDNDATVLRRSGSRSAEVQPPSLNGTKGQDATARSLARCEEMIERLAETVAARVL